MLRQSSLILSALGTLTILLAGCGVHSSASSDTLPLANSATVIPAYTPAGQETAFNAAMYPVVIAPLNDRRVLQALMTADTTVSGTKKPVMLVLTDVSSANVSTALHHAAQILARDHVSLPWALQIGPTTLYSTTFPVMLRITPNGQTQRVVGRQDVLTALPRWIRLPKPVITGPKTSTKTTHQTPKSKKS